VERSARSLCCLLPGYLARYSSSCCCALVVVLLSRVYVGLRSCDADGVVILDGPLIWIPLEHAFQVLATLP